MFRRRSAWWLGRVGVMCKYTRQHIDQLPLPNNLKKFIYFENESNVTLKNVEFNENSAIEVGVLSSHASSRLFLEDSIFYNNHAEYDAVILFIDGGHDTKIWNWQ